MADHDPTAGTLTPEEFQQVRSIFESALQRPADERREFVAKACGANHVLRSEVERMLAADEAGDSLLDGRQVPAPRRAASTQTQCRSCGAALALANRFCPSCGTPIAAAEGEGRFRTGTLFAGRFRIVSALGRGGMGEVYRAEDLELGHTVALKFLTAFRDDSRARNRLKNEVRMARQVSHPNVCRVFDIGDAQGELYLTMEYVDGEDAAALLRRIGRVPIDKGVEIARKLCAGLAAAHAKGVLHRDFKPANIMIDGRGEVRIMDFGLAAVAERIESGDVRSGTPSYMSPEQLAGREATVRSDIYALGLVLYELFTGKPAFTARDVPELLRQRESHPATTPSTLVPELDARVERAILRCLESAPDLRPASALEVSAALPGGDPLAAVLAAGETPSPEMVAAAGPTEGLRPRVAAALLVATLACLGIVLTLTPRVTLLGHLPLQHPPEELRIRARDVVRSIGFTHEPVDIETGFRFDAQHAAYLARTAVSAEARRNRQWGTILAPGPWPVFFSYRQTDVRMIPTFNDFGGSRAVAAAEVDHIGLVSVDVALDGRLLRVVAPPREGREHTDVEFTAPWPALFTAAGLDMSRFEPAAATADVSIADARLAWTGRDSDGRPVRVEAASLQGRTTFFAVVFPWSDPARPMVAPTAQAATSLTTALVIWGLYIAFALMARHNLKLGRGDTRGAWRVGLYIGVVMLVSAVVGGFTGPDGWFPVSAAPFASGLFFALAYLAIEPWTRRLWPHVIITWTRVIAGRWRDPLVARDVLAAVTCVTASYALLRLVQFAALRAGEPPLPPQTALNFGISLTQLLGGSVMLSAMVRPLATGLWVSVVLFFLLFVSYAVIRRKWLAVIVYIALGSVVVFPGAVAGPWINTLQWMLEIGCLLFLTLRFGLLAAAVQSCLSQTLSSAALTYRFDEWYGQSSLIAAMLVIGLAVYGLRMSMDHYPLPTARYPPRDAAHI